LQSKAIDLRPGMVVVCQNGRRHRIVDRDWSPFTAFRMWCVIRLQDMDSGAIGIVQYDPNELVGVEPMPG
jgi:hypothetical protein